MKRLFQTLLILTIAGTAAVLCIGWQNPSTSHSMRIPIEAPAAYTWEQFQNFNNNKKWIEGYQTMEVVSGFPGQPGSKYRMYMEFNGSDLVLDQTLKAIDPGKQVVVDSESSLGVNTMVFTVHPMPDGTSEIEVYSRMLGGDAITCAVNKAMHKTIKAQEMANYIRFKDLVERKFAGH